jgi:hypothetical protein
MVVSGQVTVSVDMVAVSWTGADSATSYRV